MILTTQIEICTGHRLLDYNGKCAHPHGHNYKCTFELNMRMVHEQRAYGMLVDFSDFKRVVKEITEPFDHAMVLRHDDPMIPFLRSQGNRLVILDVNPTAENLACLFANALRYAFPWIASVTIWETSNHSVTADGAEGQVTILERIS